MSERIREIVDVPVSFVHEGVRFLNRCTKPNHKGKYSFFPKGFSHQNLFKCAVPLVPVSW